MSGERIRKLNAKKDKQRSKHTSKINLTRVVFQLLRINVIFVRFESVNSWLKYLTIICSGLTTYNVPNKINYQITKYQFKSTSFYPHPVSSFLSTIFYQFPFNQNNWKGWYHILSLQLSSIIFSHCSLNSKYDRRAIE